MGVFLRGLGLQFYRGIGEERQRMAPFKVFNFFIGSNNSGKSTVLNFLTNQLRPSAFITSNNLVDQHQGKTTGALSVQIAIDKHEFRKNALEFAQQKVRFQVSPMIDLIPDALAEGNFIWLTQRNEGRDWDYVVENELAGWLEVMPQNIWHIFWSLLTENSGGSPSVWVPQALSVMLRHQLIPRTEVRLIPAIRKIGGKGTGFDFSGSGLIDKLAEVQSPGHDKREERQIFDRINQFLQTVTGRTEAVIEVPHHRDHIQVHMDSKVLPLSSLGTGIEEVIMIAAFCTLSEEKIVCIEEPELHLHPILQRKLVRYLSDHTTNQYFIATHSASFIDTPNAAIFHVSNDGSQTRIRESVLRSERHDICVDLGYKASDIVQSNAVIWVEGPSDRIYVKHWIHAIDPELTEGIHYSIMFYGGRLLSHLSANADAVDRFIELRSLNQNFVLIMDSDKGSAQAKINDTKKRLLAELSKGRSLAWITKGREIENYVEHTILQEAVRSIYSANYFKPSAGGQYDHALFYERTSAKKRRTTTARATDLIERNIDKVEVARSVYSQPADLDVLDLRARLDEVVDLIRKSNA